MFKTSVATRVISLAVLVTVLFASFPTAVAAAKGSNQGLEAKWGKLMDLYHRQFTIHNSAPGWIERWLSDHNNDHSKAFAARRANLRKDLAISNSAWAPVPSIVAAHQGFDAQGHVVDRAAAKQSITDLSRALQRHNKSIKDLKALLRRYGMRI